MKHSYQRHLKGILFTALAWTFADVLFLSIKLYAFENTRLSGVTLDTSTLYLQCIIANFFQGSVYGVIDVLLDTRRIRNLSFGFVILLKSTLYVISGLGLTIIALPVLLKMHFMDVVFIFESQVLKENIILGIVYMLVVSLLINFIKQMNHMLGPGVLYQLLTGKYYHPQEQEKIFMFLDLKSSTHYAEKLGHFKYSQLIQDCYDDLTSAVINSKAEIYQYVGDEVVLIWKPDAGFEQANCIRAYFIFVETLQKKTNYYLQNYGFVPEFKAGLNYGSVMAAQVGVIKREIAYHGDAINTAARIQSKCNELGKKLLISESIMAKLSRSFNNLSEFNSMLVGNMKLRGKSAFVNIYSIEEKRIKPSTDNLSYHLTCIN